MFYLKHPEPMELAHRRQFISLSNQLQFGIDINREIADVVKNSCEVVRRENFLMNFMNSQLDY